MSIYSLAMNSANYAIDLNVINGGGDNANSTSYRIKASAGQSAIDSAAGTSYQLEAGYWPGVDGGIIPSYQSDNHIKNSSEGTYIGDNIYNSDGVNQTKAQNVDNDATATYHIRLENDGNNADTFVVTGIGGDTNWTVIYYDALSGGSDITGSVTGGGWSTGLLASGATTDIRVEVTPGAGVGGGSFRNILVTSTSQGDANVDAVEAVTTVNGSVNYQTDSQIKNSSEGTYSGDNVYNNDGNQFKDQNVNNDETAIYHIKVENDGNSSDTFVVNGNSGDADLYCFDTKTARIVEVIISKTKLHPGYPNPFRPGKGETTTIQYDLGEDVNSIEVEIYSLAGQLIRKWSGNTQRGRHRISWDASNQGGRMISSGMYFIVIKENGKVMDRKRIVVIIKTEGHKYEDRETCFESYRLFSFKHRDMFRSG